MSQTDCFLLRTLTFLVVVATAASCGGTGNTRPREDQYAVFAPIVDVIIERDVTMPTVCSEPVRLFVAVEDRDLPDGWLEQLSRPCHEFLRGSEYETDEGVRVRFGAVQWSDRTTATVKLAIRTIGGGGGGYTYTLEAQADNWLIVNRQVNWLL